MAEMEATQSGVLKELSNFFSNPLVTGVLGVIGGAIGTLGWKVIDLRFDEIKEDRKQRKARKLQAAQDITSFCIVGMHTGFRHKAGSERAIKFRAAEIEAIDLEVGIKLREFLGAWNMHRVFIKDKPAEVQNERIAIEYKNKAQKLGDELLDIARMWAK